MKKNKVFKMLLLLLVWLAFQNQVFSQNDNEVKTLVGFDTLSVEVVISDPSLEKTGLTKEQILTDVEIKLRRNGFNVKSRKELYEPYVYLLVDLQSYSNANGVIIYTAQTMFIQKVVLDRNKSLSTWTSTWETGYVGNIIEQRTREIRDIISDQINKFINDYLKANASAQKQNVKPSPTYTPPSTPRNKQDDSPFTATYVGGNSPPTIEVFNDTDRTMYFDFGQGKMTAYTIPSGKSQKITIPEGIYNFKASAPRVRSDEGQETFNKGYAYTWRFYIVTVPR